MTSFVKFDPSDYLDNEEVIAEYLSTALADPNPAVLLAALSNVAKACGMARLAADSGLRPGLGRETLYKALAPGAKPRYEAVLKVLNGLGVRLHVEATQG